MADRTQVGSAWTFGNTGNSASIVFPSRNITAGSLVVVWLRFEASDRFTSITDSVGATWRVNKLHNSNVGVAMGVSYNHPGGTGVVITANFSDLVNYRYGTAAEYTGDDGADPFEAWFTSTSSPASFTQTVSSATDTFLAQSSYSGSTFAATSPATMLYTASYQAQSHQLGQTSTTRTHAHTGGSGNQANLLLVLKRPLPASQTLVPPLFTNSQTFYDHTLTGGTAVVAPPLLTNTTTFYGAVVTGGDRQIYANALSFAANDQPNSNVALTLDGLSRTEHTFIWKSKRSQQTGYTAEAWHISSVGPWENDIGWAYGTHPYPSPTGAYDEFGERTEAWEGTTPHYAEIAGLKNFGSTGRDYLSSPESIVGSGNQASYLVDETGTVWVTNMRTAYVLPDGVTLRHEYFPDIENHPDWVILQDIDLDSINEQDATQNSRKFVFGAPPWTEDGDENSETPYGKHYYFKAFNARLSVSDGVAEAVSYSDDAVTSAGIASAHYSNIFLSVDDITDKSGNANDMAWRTAYRPTDYEFSIAIAPLFTNSSQFYSPTVSLEAEEQTLTPGLLTNTQTFYAPTVSRGAVTVSPGLFSNSQTFYAPAVGRGAVSLVPGLLTNTQTFFAPTVSRGAVSLTPGLFSNSQTFYGPTVTTGAVVLQPGLLTNVTEFYAPVVSAGGAVLQPTLLTNSQAFYAPTVSVGAVTISPPLLTNTTTFYEPVVSGGVVLQAPLVVNEQVFYAPAVTAGEVELLPPLLVNEAIFYGPVVGSGAVVSPPLLTNSQSFYSPTVSRGAVILAPGLLENAQQFYAPTIVQYGEEQFLLPSLLVNGTVFHVPTVAHVPTNIQVDEAFIARPEPRNWTARNTVRNWEART